MPGLLLCLLDQSAPGSARPHVALCMCKQLLAEAAMTLGCKVPCIGLPPSATAAQSILEYWLQLCTL